MKKRILALALRRLGIFCQNGTGDEQSDETSMEYFRKAAALGDETAAAWVEANEGLSGK